MLRLGLLAALLAAPLAACGSDADDLGVGGQCTSNDQCDAETMQVCLTNFKGGYCGLMGCTLDSDCPEASACVTHNGANYCFRICNDKPECNANRNVENEANCSSSVTFADPAHTSGKACVPPSG